MNQRFVKTTAFPNPKAAVTAPEISSRSRRSAWKKKHQRFDAVNVIENYGTPTIDAWNTGN